MLTPARLAQYVLPLMALGSTQLMASTAVDQQIEQLRARVSAHSVEVNRFEQELLHPVDTRVAVFLTLAGRNGLEVDAVELFIDGQPVASHLYSKRERNALERGGVQQLFTGNLSNGGHEIKAVISVRTAKDQFIRRESVHRFTKSTGTHRLQLALDAHAPDYEPDVTITEWK